VLKPAVLCHSIQVGSRKYFGEPGFSHIAGHLFKNVGSFLSEPTGTEAKLLPLVRLQ
jgi:hypothetical protein